MREFFLEIYYWIADIVYTTTDSIGQMEIITER